MHFQPLTLYDEQRDADTEANEIKVKELQWEHYTAKARLDVSYRSDHGQDIFLFAALTDDDQLDMQTMQNLDFWAVRKLIESEGEIKISFNPIFALREQEVKTSRPDDISHIIVMLFQPDQMAAGTGNYFFKKILEVDDLW